MKRERNAQRPDTKSVMGGRGKIRGEHGKFLVSIDGKDLCPDYNISSCRRDNCDRLHACSFCGVEGHTNKECKDGKAYGE